jgi:hypothetical protein
MKQDFGNDDRCFRVFAERHIQSLDPNTDSKFIPNLKLTLAEYAESGVRKVLHFIHTLC